MQHQKAFTETLLEIGVNKINTDFKSFKHHTDSFIAKEIYEKSQNKPFTEDKDLKFKNGLYFFSAEHKFEQLPKLGKNGWKLKKMSETFLPQSCKYIFK